MKILKISAREYPYYIAEFRTGRFKGQYPAGIAHIPSLERQWDQGKFGNHHNVSIEKSSLDELFSSLKREDQVPPFFDVSFYIVEAPGMSRKRVRYDARNRTLN